MNPDPPVPPAFPLDLTHILYLAGILVAAILLGIVVQRLLSRQLHRLAKGTATVWDDVLVESVKGVVVLWFFLIGLAVVLKLVPLKPELLVPVRRGLGVLGIVSAVLFFSRLARKVIYVYIDRIVDVPTTLFKNSATVVIYLLGFLVTLDYVGVSITPLVTALGVSGVGFALAMQDTLSNLFAGLSILMSRKVRPGELHPPGHRRRGRRLRHHLAQHDHPESREQPGRRAQRQAGLGHRHQHPPAGEGDGPVPARHGRLRQRPGPSSRR